MRDVMSPYSEMLKSQGIEEGVMVRNLMNAHYRLTTAPEEEKRQLINQIAQSYGLSMDGEEQKVDPALKAIQDKVNSLENHLSQAQQATLQEARAKVERDVEAFASDPAHEFFDEVSEQIVPLINSGYSLEDAYKNAIWLNPVTRQKEIDRTTKKAAEDAEKAAKEQAEKARKAKSVNVRGRDTGRTPTEPTGTMEDTMREVYREIQNRSH
jgi:ATP-dependent Clp protease ATP-binding subunit ClpA